MPPSSRDDSRRWVNESQARSRRAFKLIKVMALQAKIMRHQNDTAGFDKYCDLLDAAYPADDD